MTTTQVIVLVGSLVAVDAFVVMIIMRAVIDAGWGALSRNRRREPDGPGAVRREFQSFRIGMSNFGGCLHLTVDERFLHVDPAAILRWFGARPFSVPWDDVEWVGEKPMLGMRDGVRVRIGGKDVIGPGWALRFADRSIPVDTGPGGARN